MEPYILINIMDNEIFHGSTGPTRRTMYKLNYGLSMDEAGINKGCYYKFQIFRLVLEDSYFCLYYKKHGFQ